MEVSMTTTYTSTSVTAGETAAYGGFVDALGGIATIVLAIIALSGVSPDLLLSIATVVFAVALLIQGGAMLSELAEIESFGGDAGAAGAGGLSALFLAGLAGIVLGVLALLNVYALTLASIALIAFGAALTVSASAVWRLLTVKSIGLRFQSRGPFVRMLASEVAAGSVGIQAIAGLTAIVLGILAVADVHAQVLALVGLLVASSALVMTGSTLSGTLLGFMRASPGVTVEERLG
jgi:hypothetical protein